MSHAKLELISDTELKVTLITPIKRGGEDVYEINVREPKGRHLEGISQKMLDFLETSTIASVLQKITTPQLSREEYLDMSMAEIQLFGAAITFFTLPPTNRREAVDGMRASGLLAESTEPGNSSPSAPKTLN